jgi:hypothetical protein
MVVSRIATHYFMILSYHGKTVNQFSFVVRLRYTFSTRRKRGDLIELTKETNT